MLAYTDNDKCHNGFPLDLDDLKNKWSRHRSFLYGCDRSPKMRVLKLEIEIPNLDELAGKGKSLQDKTLEKYELLEERMRAMEGINILGSLDATELSLVPSLVIPHKFKTPTFDKYDDTKCPMTHLTMYYRKMSVYIDNDKLLIYCFQDSLTRIAA